LKVILQHPRFSDGLLNNIDDLKYQLRLSLDFIRHRDLLKRMQGEYFIIDQWKIIFEESRNLLFSNVDCFENILRRVVVTPNGQR